MGKRKKWKTVFWSESVTLAFQVLSKNGCHYEIPQTHDASRPPSINPNIAPIATVRNPESVEYGRACSMLHGISSKSKVKLMLAGVLLATPSQIGLLAADNLGIESDHEGRFRTFHRMVQFGERN